MAHFAELNDSNIVLRVIVVNNEDILDEDETENEQVGIQFCENLLGGRWIQTSYNRTFRKHYAGTGFSYDEQRDAFIPPKHIDTWVLDEEQLQWIPPIQYPTDGKCYQWDYENNNWILCTDIAPQP